MTTFSHAFSATGPFVALRLRHRLASAVDDGERWDIAPDGSRFLFLLQVRSKVSQDPLRVTLGWLDDVHARLSDAR